MEKSIQVYVVFLIHRLLTAITQYSTQPVLRDCFSRQLGYPFSTCIFCFFHKKTAPFSESGFCGDLSTEVPLSSALDQAMAA